MKAFLTFLFLVASINAYCQGEIRMTITVVNTSNKAVPGLAINAFETLSLKKITGRTDPSGKAILNLTGGREWSVDIGEIRKAVYVESVPGRIVTVNRSFIYNPYEYKRKSQQDPTRANEKFRIVDQHYGERDTFGKGNCMLIARAQTPEGRVHRDMEILAVNVADSVIYRAKTDQRGMAVFILPNKSRYEIDVDGLKNFSYSDFGDDYKIYSLSLMYVPTVVQEKIIRDTVFQEVNAQAQPSSQRTLMQIGVQGGRKNGVRENIYLRQLPSGKVYAATTNDQGIAYFLIPFKFVYMIDMTYQKDIDAVNLRHTNDLTSGKMRVFYQPDPRLEYPETFIPTPDRLLLHDFNTFLEKQFTRPKDKAFAIVLKPVKRISRNSREALFTLSIAGAENNAALDLPMNAALVLDKSGSMFSNDREAALKLSLQHIASIFTAQDNISVILFDDHASLVLESDGDHSAALKLVSDNYTPGGSTNILDGLQVGAESILRNYDKSKTNKIILLTDGYGDNPPKDITDFVQAQFAKGVEFSTIGLGADYNQSLLELIARSGNGSFSAVEDSETLPQAFMKQVKGIKAYTARDVRIEVMYNQQLVFSHLYGYPAEVKGDGRIQFGIGKILQGHNELAFLKFKLASPSASIEQSPLRMKVSYFDLLKNATVSFTEDVRLMWTDETDTEFLLDHEEKKLYAIAILNQSLKLMAEAHERSDDRAAKAALIEGKKQIEEIFPDAKPKEVRELFDEVVKYVQLFEQIAKNK